MLKFSVLMSVYKDEKPMNFSLAMRSIWDEQLIKPNEIVLVIDGPIGRDLKKEIDTWGSNLKSTLKVVVLPENRGLALALNEGLKRCSYDLIARMDTDDISLPNRFKEQVIYMYQHPEISASSCYIEEWNENLSQKLFTKKLPLDSDHLFSFAKKRCPLVHPAVIFRKEVIKNVGGYPIFKKAQDYALWSVLLNNGYRISNMPQVLLKMRTGQSLFARRSLSYLIYEIKMIKFQYEIGFLNFFEYLRNIAIRLIMRLLPAKIQKLIYVKFRD